MSEPCTMDTADPSLSAKAVRIYVPKHVLLKLKNARKVLFVANEEQDENRDEEQLEQLAESTLPLDVTLMESTIAAAVDSHIEGDSTIDMYAPATNEFKTKQLKKLINQFPGRERRLVDVLLKVSKLNDRVPYALLSKAAIALLMAFNMTAVLSERNISFIKYVTLFHDIELRWSLRKLRNLLKTCNYLLTGLTQFFPGNEYDAQITPSIGIGNELNLQLTASHSINDTSFIFFDVMIERKSEPKLILPYNHGFKHREKCTPKFFIIYNGRLACLEIENNDIKKILRLAIRPMVEHSLKNSSPQESSPSCTLVHSKYVEHVIDSKSKNESEDETNFTSLISAFINTLLFDGLNVRTLCLKENDFGKSPLHHISKTKDVASLFTMVSNHGCELHEFLADIM